MSRETRTLDRRTYLTTTGVATAGMIGLAGCTGNGALTGTEDDDGETDDGATEETDGDDETGETQTGTLSTSVTDQPNDIGDFQSLVVTIDGIWIKPATGDDDGSDAGSDRDSDAETEGDADAGDTDSESDNGENGDSDNESDGDSNNDGDNESNGDSESDGDSDGDSESDDNTDGGDDNTEDEGDGNGQGRRYIAFDEPQTADLVELQGNNTQLIDETAVAVGQYRFLQLDVSNTEGVLAEDGSDADVETPGNAPLMFNAGFEIRAGERTRFIADFAPQRRGQQGSYIIRPVASGTTVLYGDEEYTADDDATNGRNNEGDANGETGEDTDNSGGGTETGSQNGTNNANQPS